MDQRARTDGFSHGLFFMRNGHIRPVQGLRPNKKQGHRQVRPGTAGPSTAV